jgi:hypothetical protein
LGLALHYVAFPFFQFTVGPLYTQYERWVLSHKGYPALAAQGALSALGVLALCIAVKLYKQKETKGGIVFSGLTALTLAMIGLTAAPAWSYCYVKNAGALAAVSFLGHVCVYGPLVAIYVCFIFGLFWAQ